MDWVRKILLLLPKVTDIIQTIQTKRSEGVLIPDTYLAIFNSVEDARKTGQISTDEEIRVIKEILIYASHPQA